MRRSVFRMEDISVRSDAAMSLSDFSLELSEGEIMGVVGASNSGKSALCRMLKGKERLCSGLLYYHDRPLQGKRVPGELAKRVALIEIHSTPAPSLSVAELLALVNPKREGQLFLNQKWIREEAERILDALSIAIPPDARASQLSLSQRHLILIAEACLQHAELIALNNTISGYTDQEWNEVKRTLRIVLEQGTAVLLTSNRETRLIQVCDHIAVLGQRTNLKVFEPEDYPVLKSVLTLSQNEGGSDQTARPMLPEDRTGMFRAAGISTQSLRNADFELRRGEIVGFYDPNNMAGQELYAALTAMDPGKGRFELDGKTLDKMTAAKALKLGIGFMPDNAISRQLFLQQSALDNILCASREKLGRGFLFRRRALEHLAATCAQKIGVEKQELYARTEQFDNLGRLRIYLSRWEFVRLRLMVCNCVFETADLEAKDELLRFFRSLAAKGTAVCLFGYDRAALLEVCDSIYMIENDSVGAKHANRETAQLL